MADTKITALAAITTVDPAADVLPIVDISDTSMAASGTTKKITSNQILGSGGTATLASATITGDLTVDTSTLKVDSANDAVGIGTVTPASYSASKLTVYTAANTLLTIGQATSYSNLQSNGYDFYINTNVGGAGSNAGSFTIRHGSSSAVQYNITSGVHTWQNVGGVAGTAMTLNSTGLGVGESPVTGQKLTVNGDGSVRNGNKLNLWDTGNSTAHGIYNSGDNLTFSKNNGTTSMTLDASGNLLVGKTTTAATALGGVAYIGRVDCSRDTGNAATFNHTTAGNLVGNIAITSTATTYNSASDYRLKEAVQPISGGLARVSALKPSMYKWKSDGSSGEGFLAHELAEVVPFAVTGEKDAVNEDGSIKSQGIDMSRIVPILVAAIQELAAEVNALKKA